MIDNNQARQLFANIHSKWENDKNCPICNSTDWIANEKMYKLSELGDNPNFIPIMTIMCKKCGYVHMFNALLNGLKINT